MSVFQKKSRRLAIWLVLGLSFAGVAWILAQSTPSRDLSYNSAGRSQTSNDATPIPSTPTPTPTPTPGPLVIAADAPNLEQAATPTSIYPQDDSQLPLKGGNFSMPSLPSGYTFDWIYPSATMKWSPVSGQTVEYQIYDQYKIDGQYCELDGKYIAPQLSPPSPAVTDHGIKQKASNLKRGSYLLFFDYRARPNAANQFTIKALLESQGASEVTLATVNPNGNDWKRGSVAFEIKGGDPETNSFAATFSFDITDPPDGAGAFIDNVILLPLILDSFTVTGEQVNAPVYVIVPGSTDGIEISATAKIKAVLNVPPNLAGNFNLQIIQDINLERTRDYAIPPPTYSISTSNGEFVHDDKGGDFKNDSGQLSISFPDAPRIGLAPKSIFKRMTANDSFNAYIQYSYSNGPWKTIAKATWTLKAHIELNSSASGGWSGSATTSNATGVASGESPKPDSPNSNIPYDVH